jgi:hypothetical protein
MCRILNRLLISSILMSFAPAVLARAADGGLPSARVPDGLGVNIHFTDPQPGELEMLETGGFRFVRTDFTWAGTERKGGEYDFSAYDRLLAALDKHHLRAVLILDYGNPLYGRGDAPATDASRAAFSKWVVAGVSHFRNRSVIWEIWNEPNIFFWKPKPNADAYAKLALAVGNAIRQTPEIASELYIGPAVSTIDVKFLETCFKAGCLDYWDAVSLHPYREDKPNGRPAATRDPSKPEFNHAGDPETVLADYAKVRALIERYAPKDKTIPIISGEWGYSAGWQGRGAWRAYDPQRQGKMLARQWLVNLFAGVPVSIWYDWHDDGTNRDEPEHHFGTVEHEYHAGRSPVFIPKPAYSAAQTLTKTLAGFQFENATKSGQDNEFVLAFRNGERRAWATWTTREPRNTTLALPAGNYKVISLLGQTRDASAGTDGLPLTLSDAVQYVVQP